MICVLRLVQRPGRVEDRSWDMERGKRAYEGRGGGGGGAGGGVH